MNPLTWLARGFVRVYQVTISPLLGPSCKYYPSCSSYALEALELHGFFKGTGLAMWRVLRCNPWSRGGVDFPPGSTREVPIPPDEPGDDADSPHEDVHFVTHRHLHTSNGEQNISWT